jgi:hypothetical protein
VAMWNGTILGGQRCMPAGRKGGEQRYQQVVPSKGFMGWCRNFRDWFVQATVVTMPWLQQSSQDRLCCRLSWWRSPRRRKRALPAAVCPAATAPAACRQA